MVLQFSLNEANKSANFHCKQPQQHLPGKLKTGKKSDADAEIRLYGRENSSGTYTLFHDEVVIGDYAATVQSLPGTSSSVNAVKKDIMEIGYGGAAYAVGVKHAKVKKDNAVQLMMQR